MWGAPTALWLLGPPPTLSPQFAHGLSLRHRAHTARSIPGLHTHTRGLVPPNPSAQNFWENGSSRQPGHPSLALSCWGSSPSPEHLLGAPSLPGDPREGQSPGLGLDPLRWPGSWGPGGLGVPTQLFGMLVLSLARVNYPGNSRKIQVVFSVCMWRWDTELESQALWGCVGTPVKARPAIWEGRRGIQGREHSHGSPRRPGQRSFTPESGERQTSPRVAHGTQKAGICSKEPRGQPCPACSLRGDTVKEQETEHRPGRRKKNIFPCRPSLQNG